MANVALRIRPVPGRGVIYHPASRIVPRPIRSVQSAGWCRIDGNLLAYRPVAFARAEVVWFGRERARTAGLPGPIFGPEIVPRGMVRRGRFWYSCNRIVEENAILPFKEGRKKSKV